MLYICKTVSKEVGEARIFEVMSNADLPKGEVAAFTLG